MLSYSSLLISLPSIFFNKLSIAPSILDKFSLYKFTFSLYELNNSSLIKFFLTSSELSKPSSFVALLKLISSSFFLTVKSLSLLCAEISFSFISLYSFSISFFLSYVFLYSSLISMMLFLIVINSFFNSFSSPTLFFID